jgi:hypothetical protein
MANKTFVNVVELRMESGQILIKEVVERDLPEGGVSTRVMTSYLNKGDDLSNQDERVKKIAEFFWNEVYDK